jgi:hypothetical protein
MSFFAIAVLRLILKVLFLAILASVVFVNALGGTYTHQFSECYFKYPNTKAHS